MEAPADKTKVIILTGHNRIIGDIAHFSDTRLTDYMVETKAFIAVTNAEVMNREGKRILKLPFLNVGRNQIEVIAPYDEAELF